MKQVLFFTIIFTLCLSTYAQQSYKVNSANITFSIKNAGLQVTGSLSEFEGTIVFDAKKLAGSNIKGSVKVSTLKTGIESRDKHLKKEEYFDANQFPQITIESSFFGRTEMGFKAYCKLTIKGITTDIVIPFTFIEKNNSALLKGGFTLNRLDYKVGKSSLILSNDVFVNITLNLES